jgi:5-(carboxyamino)imidazole ribonucleotide synthase
MKIGIIGGGQLGRMLALAGYPLNLQSRVLDPTPDSPAGQVTELVIGDYADQHALDELINGIDLITYEFENVPVDSARYLSAKVPIHPAPQALEVSQDRLSEKTLFQSLGIPTPTFACVDSVSDLTAAIDRVGLPAVLKTRRLGYDGKGQFVIRTHSEIETAWSTLGSQPLILEGFVNFDRELSILAVRGRGGTTAFYPLVENHHREGILRLSIPQFSNSPILNLQALAESIATRLLDSLNYVGLLALELFQVGDQLLANEMAPRVHNSGHWTIEGAATSQFENHLRAIAGLPLGSTELRGHSAMLNLIGTTPDPKDVLAIPGAHLHLYGKSPRPGRKLGHITFTADSDSILQSLILQCTNLI